MSSFQTYIGSAFASYPVRWVESPETARSRSAAEVSEKTVEKAKEADSGKPKSASGDVLDLSPEVQRVLETSKTDSKIKLADSESVQKTELSAKSEQSAELETESADLSAGNVKLTPEEQEQVEKLKARDQEVRTHEAAHVAAGGPYVTGGPSYTYQTGPDGKKYAVGGEVGIDTGAVSGDPAATVQKMQTVAAAALAPAEPSGQDQKVAAAARQAAAKAQMELAKQNTEQQLGETKSSEEDSDSEKNDVTDKSADETKNDSSSKPSKSAVKAFAAGASASTAYRSQSAMPLSSPTFSVFA